MDGLICDDADICTDPDTCLSGVCSGPFGADPPLLAGVGSRAFSVTPVPPGSGTIQAIRITSPDHPCLLKYVDGMGNLIDTPVFMTPDDWGTVIVTGAEIVPSSTYGVQAECATDIGDVAFVSTYSWGDTDGNSLVNIFDITCALDVFQNQLGFCPFAAADIVPCTPDGVVNVFDVVMAFDAFQNGSFPCVGPCLGGGCCIGTDCQIVDDLGMCDGLSGIYQGDGINCFPNACTPAPTSPQGIAASRYPETQISLVADTSLVSAGDLLEVHLYADGIQNVRGYQLSLSSRRNQGWHVVQEEIRTDKSDFLFAGQEVLSAANQDHTILAATLDSAITTTDTRYLATFTIQIDRDDLDEFTISLNPKTTHFVDPKGNGIAVQLTGNTLTTVADLKAGTRIQQQSLQR